MNQCFASAPIFFVEHPLIYPQVAKKVKYGHVLEHLAVKFPFACLSGMLALPVSKVKMMASFTR